MGKWFILEKSNVRGPYSAEMVNTLVSDADTDVKIWGKPLKTWCSFEGWKNQHNNITEINKTSTEVWYFAINNEQHGPYSKSVLIENLTEHENHKDTMIWTKGMSEWQPLYQFYDIIDTLGINARKHPRKNISGTVTYKINDMEFTSDLLSISSEGLGFTSSNLFSGQHLQGTVNSDELGDNIHFNAEVCYATGSGSVGLKFESLHSEAKSTIMDFIKGTSKEEAA